MPKIDSPKKYKSFLSKAYSDVDLIYEPSSELIAEAWVPVDKQQKVSNVYRCWTAVTHGGRENLINELFGNERHPHTQSVLLDSNDNDVNNVIYLIRTSKSILNREKLANRLLLLFMDAKEDDLDCTGITLGSIRYFYSFLLLHTNLKPPAISLTPDYNIYASWKDEKRRLFSVHFLPNKDVRFVIFEPNKKHPQRRNRFSGTTTSDVLDEVIESHCLWDLISDER